MRVTYFRSNLQWSINFSPFNDKEPTIKMNHAIHFWKRKKMSSATFIYLETGKIGMWECLLMHVRLILFNNVLALFRAKFACNSVIRNPVFRWELCKGCVWENVKIWSSVCIEKHSCNWNSRLTRKWWLARIMHTCEACRKVKGQYSWITIGQKV